MTIFVFLIEVVASLDLHVANAFVHILCFIYSTYANTDAYAVAL